MKSLSRRRRRLSSWCWAARRKFNFPLALEEAYAATRYVVNQGEGSNLDGARVAVVGDGARGKMGAAVEASMRATCTRYNGATHGFLMVDGLADIAACCGAAIGQDVPALRFALAWDSAELGPAMDVVDREDGRRLSDTSLQIAVAPGSTYSG